METHRQKQGRAKAKTASRSSRSSRRCCSSCYCPPCTPHGRKNRLASQEVVSWSHKISSDQGSHCQASTSSSSNKTLAVPVYREEACDDDEVTQQPFQGTLRKGRQQDRKLTNQLVVSYLSPPLTVGQSRPPAKRLIIAVFGYRLLVLRYQNVDSAPCRDRV